MLVITVWSYWEILFRPIDGWSIYIFYFAKLLPLVELVVFGIMYFIAVIIYKGRG